MTTAKSFATRLEHNLPGRDNAAVRRDLVSAAIAFERHETTHASMADAVHAQGRRLGLPTGVHCCIDASLVEIDPLPSKGWTMLSEPEHGRTLFVAPSPCRYWYANAYRVAADLVELGIDVRSTTQYGEEARPCIVVVSADTDRARAAINRISLTQTERIMPAQPVRVSH
jgi:hypothetical protein